MAGMERLHRRTLQGAILGFWGMSVVAAVALPPFITGSYTGDPAFWTAMAVAPVFILLWWLAGRDDGVAPWFVAAAMATTWAFTILIQGSGYLVGNYAYLSVVILLAAFFLSARATAAYAALNIAGVVILHSIWGLRLQDLLLSLAYLVIFSALLILIASRFELTTRTLRHTNRDLVKAEMHQKQILDSTQDAIIELDAEGRICSLNARGVQEFATRVGRAPVVGDRLESWLPGQLALALQHLRAKVDDLGYAETEEVLETWQGLRALRARLQPVRDAPGRTLLVVTDVTSHHLRLRAEQDRLRKEAEVDKLRSLHAMQRDFINVASHELQTPLTPLRLQAQMLHRAAAGTLPEWERRSVEVIVRNSERMARLVDDILEVVRIGGGKLPVDLETVDVAAVAKQSVEDHLPAASERGVQLLVDAPERLVVRADPRRIEQVLNNLLRNALRFTEPGDRIAVRARPAGPGHYELEVEDTGLGMEPEQVGMLFRPFVQLHREERPGSGTGLGLAICKGLVAAHGGTIRAASKGRGRGSRFTARLPVSPTPDTPGFDSLRR